ncbi:NAD(P)-dependent oxidoreductase [Bacillus sp. FJAT-47783]|uniref:NAD(P)-dependent oxidoreductase n=1 Tax=Bacillus sp. FJAT-47783 TaxID=2922712 RepID=UPI001FAD5710|nr:NAD(P)-dependent oxidoreductase [Bacillus sp. FJAT-47783]
MKIGIVGASGKAGSLIYKEAVKRGHEVTPIVRDASKVEHPNPIVKDVHDIQTSDLSHFDVVVNAFGAPLGEEEAHVTAGHALIKALRGQSTRLIVVGGAGSLYVNEDQTIRVIDTPDFPEIFLPTAKGQARNLEELKSTTKLKWTFISPAAHFDPEGFRTGSYQIGGDNLIVNSKGNSYISYADFAIAVLDEIENPKHLNQRFSVVGEAK